MKKLLFVLIVVALAAFLLVGCIPVTPGEGEGEGETEATVVVEGAVVIDGKTYVAAGPHDIVVTFPAPVVGNVDGWLDMCTGYYGKGKDEGPGIVFFPDATKKVWTGSAVFGMGSPCCATMVNIDTGTCEEVVCIEFPVIVDDNDPYAEIEISVANCTCAGCAINFSSTSEQEDCVDPILCCGDDCSGLASWAINLYDAYPFDSCCDPTLCEEPIATCSGTVCPIDCTTECLAAGTYWAVVNLVDNVGLEATYVAKIIVSGGATTTDTCSVVVEEWSECLPGNASHFVETTDIIGSCDIVS